MATSSGNSPPMYDQGAGARWQIPPQHNGPTLLAAGPKKLGRKLCPQAICFAGRRKVVHGVLLTDWILNDSIGSQDGFALKVKLGLRYVLS